MTCFVSNARTNWARKTLVGALCPTRSASQQRAVQGIDLGQPASMSRRIDGIAFGIYHGYRRQMLRIGIARDRRR
ncbi:MAG TPA: hypothetical protein VGK75_14010 [Casimicrobiaceae bacterium]